MVQRHVRMLHHLFECAVGVVAADDLRVTRARGGKRGFAVVHPLLGQLAQEVVALAVQPWVGVGFGTVTQQGEDEGRISFGVDDRHRTFVEQAGHVARQADAVDRPGLRHQPQRGDMA